MENANGNHRLDQVLASYGADPQRWPVADRPAAAGLATPAGDEARDIDRVLTLASRPDLPDGAAERLLARLTAEPEGEVILFRPRPRPVGSLFRYAAALPLAASLALGIYLGARGSLDSFLPTTVTGSVAANAVDDTFDDLGGVGEADAYAEENLT